MKTLLAIMVLSLFCACQEDPQASQASQTQVQGSLPENLPKELQDPEDCDDKAKKVEEVVEVNLQGGGDAGCSIE